MLTSKLEVLVDFGPKPDENLLTKTLGELKSHDGVTEAIFKDGAIMVETTLPNQNVLDIVAKSSGRRAVLQGFGEAQSAVAMISSQECCPGRVMGVIRFQQVGDGALVADGSIDGLATGPHGLHVRTSGDLSQGCKLIGGHYNPTDSPHGAPGDPAGQRHVGDLGNVTADENGRTTFRIIDNLMKISDIIGRAVAVTERRDDLGRGSSPDSKIDGDSGQPVACGIIARSAGIFQNPKRVCQCDGVVVWDERDRPLAGSARRVQSKGSCCSGHGGNHSGGGQGDNNVTQNGNKPCCKV